jgi:hypothetical protein
MHGCYRCHRHWVDLTPSRICRVIVLFGSGLALTRDNTLDPALGSNCNFLASGPASLTRKISRLSRSPHFKLIPFFDTRQSRFIILNFMRDACYSLRASGLLTPCVGTQRQRRGRGWLRKAFASHSGSTFVSPGASGTGALGLTLCNWRQHSSEVGEKAAAGYVFVFTVVLHHTHAMHFQVFGVGGSRGFCSEFGRCWERAGRGGAWAVRRRCAGGARVCFNRIGREGRLQIRPGIRQRQWARFPLHRTSTVSG